MQRTKKLFIFLLLFFMILCLCGYKVSATRYNSNNTYTYYTDVNDPDTLQEILESIDLKADVSGVDVSDSIVYIGSAEYVNEILNKPLPSMRRLGTYTIFFEAFGANGNSATCEINVIVEDKRGPYVLSEYTKSELSISVFELEKFGNSFVENKVLKNIRYFDDHDMFNLNYSVDTSNVLNRTGDYEVTTTIKDQSNNSQYHHMTIHIFDEILPRFEVETDYFLASPSDGLTKDDIITRAHVLAFGNDGNQVEVHIKSNSLPQAFNTPGIYIVPLEASFNGFSSSINIYVEIIDESVPEFDLNDAVLTVTSNVKCSKEEIDAFISLKAKSDKYTYEVLNDNYSENYDQNGDYDYDVLLTYEDGREEVLHLTLRVVEDEEIKEVEEETKNPNFFQKVWNFTKHFCIVLWKIIIWPTRLLKTSK